MDHDLLLPRRDFLTASAGGLVASALAEAKPEAAERVFTPITPPAWVQQVTRMAFLTPGEVDKAAEAGAQVVHTNIVWPYYPLRRDKGGLSKDDATKLRECVEACHSRKMKLSLGLPPFPSVALLKKHPDWRVDPKGDGAAHKVEPREDNLGTRLGCNLGPWGDYLIDVCAELVEDFKVDGYSFDGNYHPPICYCPACRAAYGKKLPAKADLDDIAYREYFVWRGEKLEDHYRKLQQRLKKINPDAVIMTWTVNAGRYGHFLHSPRAMPTRLNLLFDLPMQEWWLDETNQGGSIAPAFGVAYLRAVAGGRPCASEPYLMSRGNPYSGDSFPLHERKARTLLALTHGSVTAQSLGWAGGAAGAKAAFAEVARRERFQSGCQPLPWAALLVSEQTRQFHAYKAITERFLPHLFGTFRTAMEEHLPLTLLNDWDLTAGTLAPHRVLILANAAALSAAQVSAVRKYVESGGGLVVSGETSLCDELGRPHGDFALKDLLGVSYLGRPKAPITRPALDENFSIALDENYWKHRTGVARLSWSPHPLIRDPRLAELTPQKSATFKGPLVLMSEPKNAAEVVARMTPEGWTKPPPPAVIARKFGKGRVVYLAASLDAAMWSYAYPYQRCLLKDAIVWAAGESPAIRVQAPMCVQATFYTRKEKDARQLVIHLFNNVNTTADHGTPGMDVPLREETIPIGGIRIHFRGDAPKRFRLIPEGEVKTTRLAGGVTLELPPLELHTMVVGDY
jgi:hypothetical protein